MSNSSWSHGLHSLWNSPSQNTGVGSLSLLQAIFPTQGLNPGLLRCRRIPYQLSHKGSRVHYAKSWGRWSTNWNQECREKSITSFLMSIPQSILRKSVLNIHWKDQCWSWNANTLTTWWEELTHWKRPWRLERLKGRRRMGATEDEMVGWHHWLKGHEFEQTPGDREGQGSLEFMKSQSQTQFSGWTTATISSPSLKSMFIF